MAIKSKAKGNRVELEFSKLLKKRFKKEFTRVPASGAHGTRLQKSDIREDVKEILTGDLICPSNFRFSVECKSRADFNFWDLLNLEDKEIDKWISQAERDAKISKKEFLLLIKINRKKPFAVLNCKFFDTINYKEISLLYKKKYSILTVNQLLSLDDIFFFLNL